MPVRDASCPLAMTRLGLGPGHVGRTSRNCRVQCASGNSAHEAGSQRREKRPALPTFHTSTRRGQGHIHDPCAARLVGLRQSSASPPGSVTFVPAHLHRTFIEPLTEPRGSARMLVGNDIVTYGRGQ